MPDSGICEDAFLPDRDRLFDAPKIFPADRKSLPAVRGLHPDKDGGFARCYESDFVVHHGKVAGELPPHCGADFLQFSQGHSLVERVLNSRNFLSVFRVPYNSVKADVCPVSAGRSEICLYRSNRFPGNGGGERGGGHVVVYKVSK